jgi:hypothetical protein
MARTIPPCPTTTTVAVATASQASPVPTLTVDQLPSSALAAAPGNQANALVNFPGLGFIPPFTFNVPDFPPGLTGLIQGVITEVVRSVTVIFQSLCTRFGLFCSS